MSPWLRELLVDDARRGDDAHRLLPRRILRLELAFELLADVLRRLAFALELADARLEGLEHVAIFPDHRRIGHHAVRADHASGFEAIELVEAREPRARARLRRRERGEDVLH